MKLKQTLLTVAVAFASSAALAGNAAHPAVDARADSSTWQSSQPSGSDATRSGSQSFDTDSTTYGKSIGTVPPSGMQPEERSGTAARLPADSPAFDTSSRSFGEETGTLPSPDGLSDRRTGAIGTAPSDSAAFDSDSESFGEPVGVLPPHGAAMNQR